MDKGAKIEYNTLMRKNEEGVALVRKKSGFENLSQAMKTRANQRQSVKIRGK